jgi:stage II sporulation protein D
VAAALSVVPAVSFAAPAHPLKAGTPAEIYPVPPGGVFTFSGRGFGHGHGMSQWGAYGAAKMDHLSSNQILHFYYPHTTLATRSTARTVRVLLTAANAPALGYLQVDPSPGLTVTPTGGAARTLPAKTSATKKAKAHPITAWRLRDSGAVVHLRDEAAGRWHMFAAVGSGASLSDTAGEIRVVEPGGGVTYRGAMVGELESGSLEAVDDVNLEQYLYSVVPAEMSSSWTSAALEAQAVAARTYARRGLNSPKASWFDIYGDTRDQAYAGVGRETTRTTRAVNSTAGETIVDSAGHAILAQYSAANGGWTVSGGEPYLPAKADPYDGAVPNDAHAWTTSVAASSLESAYPQVGTLREIKITGRDGDGVWGGRVTTLDLVGSSAIVPLTGVDLQFALGLRSPWFRPTPTPAAPSGLTVTSARKRVTATWKRPAHVTGEAPITGYRLSVGTSTKTVGPSLLSASIGKLAAGTYPVSVVALSAAGPGPASGSVKVKVKS